MNIYSVKPSLVMSYVANTTSFTPKTLSDALISWFGSSGAAGVGSDLENGWLISQGAVGKTTHDLWVNFLTNSGYSGDEDGLREFLGNYNLMPTTDLVNYFRADTGLYYASSAVVAAAFNGTDEYLSRADEADLEMGDNDFSICGWVRLAGFPVEGASMFSKYQAAAGGRSYDIRYVLGDGQWYFITSSDGTTTTNTATTGFTTNLNAWVFIVATYNKTTDAKKIYCNGELKGSGTHAGGCFDNAEPLRVGCINSGYFLKGSIASVGLWKGRELSAAEVTWLYNSGSGRIYTDLTAAYTTSIIEWWDLAEASGNRTGAHAGKVLTDNNTVGSGPGLLYAPTTDTNPVDQLADHRGLNYPTFFRGSATARPVRAANVFPSGLAGMYFTTDDFLHSDYLGNLLTGSDKAVTVAVLVKPDDIAGNYAFASIGDSANAIEYQMFYNSGTTGELYSYKRDDASASKLVTHGTNIAAATAYSLIYTHDTTAQVYKNGVAGTSGDLNVNGCSFDTFSIGVGRRGTSAVYYLKGSIGAIAVYNRVLGASEIAQLNAAFMALGGL